MTAHVAIRGLALEIGLSVFNWSHVPPLLSDRTRAMFLRGRSQLLGCWISLACS